MFLANVTFEPGCRNNWHIHHAKSGGGQLLICTAGGRRCKVYGGLVVSTTIGVRLLASVLLAIVFDMGVIGIALVMSFDWCVQAVAFYIRFKGGKWKDYQLI